MDPSAQAQKITTASASMSERQEDCYKMLLIGETGCGKTSFVNLFRNYAQIKASDGGIDADKIKRLISASSQETETTQKMASRTTEAELHSVHFGDLQVSLIDTPGFGDSLRPDGESVQKIVDTIKAEKYVNCVCLIVHGRQCCMSAQLKHVVSEILPAEIWGSIVVIFSNAASPLMLNFNIKQFDNFFDGSVRTFCIDNPYCLLERVKQSELAEDTVAASLLKSFEDTARVLDEMYLSVKDLKPVYTVPFIDDCKSDNSPTYDLSYTKRKKSRCS